MILFQRVSLLVIIKLVRIIENIYIPCKSQKLFLRVINTCKYYRYSTDIYLINKMLQNPIVAECLDALQTLKHYFINKQNYESFENYLKEAKQIWLKTLEHKHILLNNMLFFPRKCRWRWKTGRANINFWNRLGIYFSVYYLEVIWSA